MRKSGYTFGDCENISNVLLLFLCQRYTRTITFFPVSTLWTITLHVAIFFATKAPHIAFSSRLGSRLTLIIFRTFFLCSFCNTPNLPGVILKKKRKKNIKMKTPERVLPQSTKWEREKESERREEKPQAIKGENEGKRRRMKPIDFFVWKPPCTSSVSGPLFFMFMVKFSNYRYYFYSTRFIFFLS